MTGGERGRAKAGRGERGKRNEAGQWLQTLSGNSEGAWSFLILCIIAGVGARLVCTPAARSQSINHQRQASPLCLAPEGPCGGFPVGWEQGSPVPAHPRTPGRWPRSAEVGSTGALLPTALRDRGSLALSWRPMKLARPSSLSHRFTHKGLFKSPVLSP